MITAGSTRGLCLMGVGYEGRDIDSFVQDLVCAGISLVVDVRLTPMSRKPGFSKTALGHALGNVGIGYDHRPELGNPKANRAGFGGSAAELNAARAVFAARLAQPPAQDAIDALIRTARSERVALLCFEADQHRCHRDVVLDTAIQRAGQRSG